MIVAFCAVGSIGYRHFPPLPSTPDGSPTSPVPASSLPNLHMTSDEMFRETGSIRRLHLPPIAMGSNVTLNSELYLRLSVGCECFNFLLFKGA
jgi:hypothetical protein